MNDNLKLFRAVFGDVPDGMDVVKVRCIWHEGDNDPSLALYMNDGHFHCYGCGKTGQIREITDISRWINEDEVGTLHRQLMREPELLKWLRDVRGYSEQTVKALKIGYDGARFTFPVRNKDGLCINIRKYGPTMRPKVISYDDGFGAAAWFPCPPIEDDIFIMEGETDTILARQMGLPAYTQTCGAGNWDPDLTTSLSGKTVRLVYDTDMAGRKGAAIVVNNVKFSVKEVYNILLPTAGKNKDFSDYMLKDGGTMELFMDIVHNTAPYAVGAPTAVTDQTVQPMHLWETSESRWAFKPVQTEVVVAGKDRAPYLVPKKIVVECTSSAGNRSCSVCPNVSGRHEYDMTWEDAGLLRMVDLPEDKKEMCLKGLLNINKACRSPRFRVTEYQNLEKLALYPKVDWKALKDDVNDFTNVLRTAFFVGSGIRSNNAYQVKGLPVPNPQNQNCVLLIFEAAPIQKDCREEVNTALLEQFRAEAKQDEPVAAS